jgi:DNA-binding MarR family transcriptional regulator
MIETGKWQGEVSFPALLRAARRAYGAAIAAEFSRIGCDDIPRNGAFVLGATARTGAPLSEIIRSLGVSKQVAGQLIDTLVARGYLDRSVDPQDRRRLTITLTERGSAAAAASKSAIETVDAALIRRMGAESVAHARATLAALVEIHREAEQQDSGGPA